MSAPPSFRQFQEAQARGSHPAEPEAIGALPPGGAWREVPPGAHDEAQGAWTYVRHNGKSGEASKTETWPRTVRLGLIGVLSLTSWALVLGAGHVIVAAIK